VYIYIYIYIYIHAQLQTSVISLTHDVVLLCVDTGQPCSNIELVNVSGVFSGNKIEKNEMGVACSAYGGDARRIQGFGKKTLGKETTWKTHAYMGGK
jgi:hypothetical protein